MGEMEQLRKEADSLKDQITVSWPQYIICGRSSIIHILFCLTCVDILFLTALCVCVCVRVCSAGSSQGGAGYHTAGGSSWDHSGGACPDEDQENTKGSSCQDLCNALVH